MIETNSYTLLFLTTYCHNQINDQHPLQRPKIPYHLHHKKKAHITVT